ncbi:MAG: NAD-dependent epimerase/dehydratase family protein [Woeseiaceae bacterium]
MKRVLVTCVGSGVGQSVVDSLKHLKHEYYLVGSDQSRFCYPVADCDDFVSLPRIDHPDYLDNLLEVCVDRRIDALIPGHDLELAPLARHRKRFESVGVQVIVGDATLVSLLRDKLAWSRELRKRTECVVASCSIAQYRRDGRHDDIRFPAIAKPSGGSASAGLRILHGPGDLADLPDEFVIQPFLFPVEDDPELESIKAAVAAGQVAQLSEISVQLAYSADGELLGRFASRNRLKAGVPVEVQPLDVPSVWAAVDEVAAALSDYEPRGPVNLQGRITEQGLVFFEMNPRFTGITGNRAQFGFNEVSLLVDNFVTGEKRELFVNHNKIGTRQVACRTWPRPRYDFGRPAQSVSPRQSVLVLGGTSWLARHFVTARATAGDRVFVVCREQSVADAQRAYAGSVAIRVFSERSSSLKDAFGWADTLVNFVSGRPPHGTRAISDAYVSQLQKLDLAEACEVPNIVNISSQSVYAVDGSGTMSEDAAIDATEPYAFSKYAIEESIVSLARRRPSVSAVSLRLARLFGAAAGLRPNEFPHRVIANAVDDLEIEVRGAHDLLDLLDVRDAVRAVSFFVDGMHAAWRGEVFNVGSGRPVSVSEYVGLADRHCRERFGRALRVVEHRQGVGRLSGLDCSKLERAGWAPAIPLERSIEDLFEHFVNERR